MNNKRISTFVDNEWYAFYRDVDKDYICNQSILTILELFYNYLNDKSEYCKKLMDYYNLISDKYKADYWKERYEKEIK